MVPFPLLEGRGLTLKAPVVCTTDEIFKLFAILRKQINQDIRVNHLLTDVSHEISSSIFPDNQENYCQRFSSATVRTGAVLSKRRIF